MEHAELGSAQRDGVAVDPHLVPAGVNHYAVQFNDIAALLDLLFFFLLGCYGHLAAKHCAHAGHQHRGTEGLGNVVGRTAVQPAYDIRLLTLGREHDDRHFAVLGADRSRWHTVSPSMPGSIRSNRIRSGVCVVATERASSPVPTPATW